MNRSHLKTLFFLLMLAAAMPLFAADIMPSGMNTLATNVLDTFTGGFVKTILIICLAGCAIAYGFNKDNEKMKRNIIAIAVAIGILATASFIVGSVWDAAKTN